MSLWESQDAIRAFAGDNLEVAFFPDDDRFLVAGKRSSPITRSQGRSHAASCGTADRASEGLAEHEQARLPV